MTKRERSAIDDLRGASRLAVEATRRVTDLVEAMHRTIGGGPAILGQPLAGPTRVFTEPVYDGVRAVTRLVGAGIDQALAMLAPLVGETVPGPEREAFRAALGGVLGDFLADSGNPLAIEMRLRHDGHPLLLEREALRARFPRAGGRLLVLVHGSCLNDQQWARQGHDHGAALARDLGFTPVYLHYNSGLHISKNGRAFADLLEPLIAQWPVPVVDLVILAHSMGGLLARSACHLGELQHHEWRGRLSKLLCLGSPHHGAPLERGGHSIDVLLDSNRYSAPLARLGRLRSAGVTDLRFGNVRDEDWDGHDRFGRVGDVRRSLPLPEGVECYAIAATSALEARDPLPSDGLVPVDSALGRHPRPELALAFPETHQWIGFGMQHLDLLSRPEVYATIRGWLAT